MSIPPRDELEAEITATRSDLGVTVEALSHKLDIKSRARRRAREAPTAVPIGAALVGLALAVVLWRRRA